ncbi:MAG TPA: hypothetical protein VIY51_11300 [Xanthobacteraceae bacterium]
MFFAGFPPLIYSLAWQRMLFGAAALDSEAVTLMVAAFGLGLGLGSLAGGWLSARGGVAPLLLLAAVELWNGVFGLASPQIFGSIGELAMAAPPSVAAALALMMVPTFLVGVALPMLVGQLARGCGHAGHALGLLHGFNILGAGAACIAGVLLFSIVGTGGAIYTAVAVNAAVALGALLAYRRACRDLRFAGGEAGAPRLVRKPMLGLVPLLSLAAVGGFVALSYQIFFFRTLATITGSGATALLATLAAFLVAFASGTRQAGGQCALLTPDGAMRRALGALMKGNILGLIFLPLLAHLGWLDRGVIAAAVLMVYFVARFWGALLPYLAELGVAADQQAGLRVAVFLLANGLGAAAGAAVTAFVSAGAVVPVLAGLACAVMLINALAMSRAEKILRASLAMALGLLALVVIPHWSM